MKTTLKIAILLLMLFAGIANSQNISQLSTATDDGQLSLQWSTAKETNSSYFLVETSKDGINFAPAAQVKAAGYSLNTRNYTYTPENTGLIYRITLVGMDGGHTNSMVLNLNWEPAPAQNGLLAGK